MRSREEQRGYGIWWRGGGDIKVGKNVKDIQLDAFSRHVIMTWQNVKDTHKKNKAAESNAVKTMILISPFPPSGTWRKCSAGACASLLSV